MHKYVAAAFSIAIAIEPAAAQTGVGVQAGGAGSSASVGVGRTGTSIGAGASIGGLGGAAAASVGTSNGSIGASIGASGRRRRKRRAVGRQWGRRLVRDWRSRRQPRRCLTLNGAQHCCHDGQRCPG